MSQSSFMLSRNETKATLIPFDLSPVINTAKNKKNIIKTNKILNFKSFSINLSKK